MIPLSKRILQYLADIATHGASDAQISAALRVRHQHVNQECRKLVTRKFIRREGLRGQIINQAEPKAATERITTENLPPMVRRSTSKEAALKDSEILTVQGLKFVFVHQIELEELPGGGLTHCPQKRYANAASLPLHNHGNQKFCRFRIPNGHGAGVYVLTENGKNVYAGIAKNLSTRFNVGYGQISPRNCFVRGQETNCRINNEILKAVECDSSVKLWFLETKNYKQIEFKLLVEKRREPSVWPWNLGIPAQLEQS